MRNRNLIQAQIAIIAIAILYGCNPTSVPVSNEPASIPNTITPVPIPNTLTPVSIPNTITPVPSVISSNTAENVVLLHTFSGQERTRGAHLSNEVR
jgi:hypothetical protein